MKTTRRIMTVVLCLILALTLISTVFATEVAAVHSHTITITKVNGDEDYTYSAYQIFSGDVATTGALSNLAWGSAIPAGSIDDMMDDLTDIPAFATCTTAVNVADVLAAVENKVDDPVTIAFADVVAKYATVSAGDSDYNDGVYTISGLDDGYYLVKNTSIPTDETDTTYTRFILKVVANVTVAHKGTYPTVDKKIVEGEERKNINNKSIGEVVSYEVTGSMPANIADYDTYYYVFNDKLSKGLTYNNDMKITVNGVNVTDYFYKDATAYSATDGTTITVGTQDLLALRHVTGVGTITKDTKVVLTYTATLNENAVIGVEGNPNVVDLTYSNDPNHDGDGSTEPPTPDKPTPQYPTGVTPEKKVTTHTTELTIKKVDGAGNRLEGAEFELTGTHVKKMVVTKDVYELVTTGTGDWYKLKDGTFTQADPIPDSDSTDDVDDGTAHAYATLTKDYKMSTVVEILEKAEDVKIKAMVGSDGIVTFTGLGAGEYTLTETKTPEGYNTIKPIEFEVKFNETEKKFHCDDNSLIQVETDNSLMVEVENLAGSTLPSTGGMGTTLFYIFGGIMVLGAAVLLITKKRMLAAE